MCSLAYHHYQYEVVLERTLLLMSVLLDLWMMSYIMMITLENIIYIITLHKQFKFCVCKLQTVPKSTYVLTSLPLLSVWEDIIIDVCSFRLVDDIIVVIDNDDNPRKYNILSHYISSFKFYVYKLLTVPKNIYMYWLAYHYYQYEVVLERMLLLMSVLLDL